MSNPVPLNPPNNPAPPQNALLLLTQQLKQAQDHLQVVNSHNRALKQHCDEVTGQKLNMHAGMMMLQNDIARLTQEKDNIVKSNNQKISELEAKIKDFESNVPDDLKKEVDRLSKQVADLEEKKEKSA
jgi:dsDNA-specific endonuclease/ATPase MutS2